MLGYLSTFLSKISDKYVASSNSFSDHELNCCNSVNLLLLRSEALNIKVSNVFVCLSVCLWRFHKVMREQIFQLLTTIFLLPTRRVQLGVPCFLTQLPPCHHRSSRRLGLLSYVSLLLSSILCSQDSVGWLGCFLCLSIRKLRRIL